MNEFIDIKYFLLKHKDENRSLEDTFNDIDSYIKQNGFFTVSDIKKAFELGEKNEENNIETDINIIDKFRNDDTIDNFVNHISTVGFFLKQDIDNVYDVGKRNGDNKKLNSEILSNLFITHFRSYLIHNFD